MNIPMPYIYRFAYIMFSCLFVSTLTLRFHIQKLKWFVHKRFKGVQPCVFQTKKRQPAQSPGRQSTWLAVQRPALLTTAPTTAFGRWNLNTDKCLPWLKNKTSKNQTSTKKWYVLRSSPKARTRAPTVGRQVRGGSVRCKQVLIQPPLSIHTLARAPGTGTESCHAVYRRRHLLLFFPRRACSAALVAISNTSRTPSFVLAEHSI